MTTPATYNPPATYEGDTSDPLAFNFTFDLSGYTIEFTIALNGTSVLLLTIGSGVTVAGTQATIGPFTVPAGDGRGATYYDYDLSMTSPDGVKTTYVRGKYKILGNTTW